MGDYLLFGKKVSLNASEERYCDMKLEMLDTADEAQDYFLELYENSKNIEHLLGSYRKEMPKYLSELLMEELWPKLAEHNIYDVTQEKFREECFDDKWLDEAYQKILLKLQNIEREKQAKKEYREQRKEGRSRVVGGGFGLEGYVKGAMTAGALNAGSGILRSGANMIGNAFSAIGASLEKSALLEAQETKDTLIEGVAWASFRSLKKYIRWMNETMRKKAKEGKGGAFDLNVAPDDVFYTKNADYYADFLNSEKAKAFFENAKNTPEKREQLLIEAFRCDPFYSELYEYIFVNYGAERRNIYAIAERFEEDLDPLVEKALAKEYTEEDRTSEERAMAAKARILKAMAELNVPSSATLNRLEQDCLLRLCASASAREELLERFRGYDALSENKKAVAEKKLLWELATTYDLNFEEGQISKMMEEIYPAGREYSKEEREKARNRMLLVMKELKLSDHPVMDRWEREEVAKFETDLFMTDRTECEKRLERLQLTEVSEKNKKPVAEKIHAHLSTLSKSNGQPSWEAMYRTLDIDRPEDIQRMRELIEKEGVTEENKPYLAALKRLGKWNFRLAKFSKGIFHKVLLFFGLAWLSVEETSTILMGIGLIAFCLYCWWLYRVLTVKGTVFKSGLEKKAKKK